MVFNYENNNIDIKVFSTILKHQPVDHLKDLCAL